MWSFVNSLFKTKCIILIPGMYLKMVIKANRLRLFKLSLKVVIFHDCFISASSIVTKKFKQQSRKIFLKTPINSPLDHIVAGVYFP